MSKKKKPANEEFVSQPAAAADSTAPADPQVIAELERLSQLRAETVDARQKLYDKAKKLLDAGGAMEDEVILKFLDLNAAQIEQAKGKLDLLKYKAGGTITK
jgi:hypothetical protein